MVLGLLAFKDRHQTTTAERAGKWLTWALARRRGLHLYRSGPVSHVPWGTHQLPGLLAASELSEWTDSWGRPFALLRVPSTGHYSVIFATEPDGASLVDPEQVDQWVAQWGAWLASLSSEPGLAGGVGDGGDRPGLRRPAQAGGRAAGPPRRAGRGVGDAGGGGGPLPGGLGHDPGVGVADVQRRDPPRRPTSRRRQRSAVTSRPG